MRSVAAYYLESAMPTFSQSKPAKQSVLFHLKTKVLRCFGFTTAHGYGRVAESESRLQTWFWALVCAAAFGIFLQQLYVITHQYLSKPLKTRTSIGHNEKIAFPQITICNLNIIRRSKIPSSIVTQFPGILGGRSNKTVSSKPRTTQSRNQAVPSFEDLPEKEKLIQNVLEMLAEIPEDNLVRYGHQIDDIILSCHFNNMECLEGDMQKYWTRFWHRRYGNCYTFNKGIDATGTHVHVMNTSQPGFGDYNTSSYELFAIILAVRGTGNSNFYIICKRNPFFVTRFATLIILDESLKFGLTLEINIEQHEYVSHLSQEAGIRVFVGVQKEMPFPYEQGISVSPGFSTAMQLRKVVIGRLDPFGNKSCEARTDLLHESMFGRYNVTYTTMACKMSCLASMMNSSCGCVIQWLKYDSKPICRTAENNSVVECLNTVFEEFDNGGCNKVCKESCREEVFKTAASLAKWPSSQYKSTLDAEIETEVHGNHSKEISDHFLKLKIYYGELNFEVIEEEEAYTMPSFLSDIGGLMGMCIGVSVLTVVELLELIATLLVTMFKTFCKKNQVVEIRPTENYTQSN